MSKGLGSYSVRAGFFLLALIISFFGLANITYAVANNEPNGFTISPVISEITISKGQSKTFDITIQNPANSTSIATPIVNDFEASTNESGTPKLLLKLNSQPPVNNFISLVQPIKSISLAPHSTDIVPVTLSVPQNAFSGGYYGVIRFIPGIVGQTQNVGLVASVGSLVVVTVPGNLTERLNLVQLTAAKDGTTGSFFSGGNISVVTRLNNTGNIQTAPFGTITIKNMQGHVIDTTQLNQESPRGLILPNSIRRFTNDLTYKHWLGRYTIIANIGYGSSGQLITAKASFWYIPVWFMALIGLVIVIVVTLIYVFIRSINRRKFSRPRS